MASDERSRSLDSDEGKERETGLEIETEVDVVKEAKNSGKVPKVKLIKICIQFG